MTRAPKDPPDEQRSVGRMTRDSIRRAAREAFGYDRLLPGQEPAVRAVIGGRDTLALLPTGGGKSAVYQLAGLELPGATVVVSPLIALQHDQLASLDELGLPAAALNSGLAAGERDRIVAAFRAGELEFLLLSPEQLADDATLDAVAAGHPSLFVVDEAHCVSEWGYDFRPEYRRLGAVAEVLGRPPILALTATASPAVRDDIVRWLRLRDPAIVARGFDRPNIELSVGTYASERQKRDELVRWVVDRDGSGIVYTATRRATVETAATLREAGVAADPYHAGLGARRRSEIQDAFMRDEVRVIVATIAFGMGIDKPDVRFVAHLDVSESLDAYHQEIGRAGRDGAPAEARLFYRADDLALRRFQSAPGPIEEADVRAVLRVLARDLRLDGVEELARQARRSRRRTEEIVGRLEELDAVAVEPDGAVVRTGDERDPRSLAADVAQAQERRRRLAASRVEMIRGYAETAACRRRFLLNYLGEEYEAPCGRCDNDLTGRSEAIEGVEASSAGAAGTGANGWRLGDAVRHATFGAGSVSRVEGDRIVILFEDVGYRTIDVEAAAERGLLARGKPAG